MKTASPALGNGASRGGDKQLNKNSIEAGKLGWGEASGRASNKLKSKVTISSLRRRCPFKVNLEKQGGPFLYFLAIDLEPQQQRVKH